MVKHHLRASQGAAGKLEHSTSDAQIHLSKHFLNALEAAGKLVSAVLIQVPFPVTIALSFSILVSPATTVTPSLPPPSSVLVFPIWPLPMPASICSHAYQSIKRLVCNFC